MDWIFVIEEAFEEGPRIRALKVIKETPTRYYVERKISNCTIAVEGGHLKGLYVPKNSGTICTTPMQALQWYFKGRAAALKRAEEKVETAKNEIAWVGEIERFFEEDEDGKHDLVSAFVLEREAAILARKKPEWDKVEDPEPWKSMRKLL